MISSAKNRLLLLASVVAITFLSTAATHGSVLLTVSGGFLKGEISGTPVPYGTGLLLLVASTGNTAFDDITTSSVFNPGSPLSAGSDDYVLYKSSIIGDGNNNSLPDSGEFQRAVTLTLDTPVSSGNPVRLYWFPNLTSVSTSALEGMRYGAYRSPIANNMTGETDLDGSSPWFLPADGTSGYNLLFLTSDAGSAINTGTTGIDFGDPAFTVVPEPETFGLLGIGILGVLSSQRRRV